MKRLRRNVKRTSTRRGILTFEWILLISLLVIGIIGGLSAVRNSLLAELNDLDQCIQALNTSGEGMAPVTDSVSVLSEGTNGTQMWYQSGSGY